MDVILRHILYITSGLNAYREINGIMFAGNTITFFEAKEAKGLLNYSEKDLKQI